MRRRLTETDRQEIIDSIKAEMVYLKAEFIGMTTESGGSADLDCRFLGGSCPIGVESDLVDLHRRRSSPSTLC